MEKESTLPPTAIRLCAYGSRQFEEDHLSNWFNCHSNICTLFAWKKFTSKRFNGAQHPNSHKRFSASRRFHLLESLDCWGTLKPVYSVSRIHRQSTAPKRIHEIFLSHHKDVELFLCVRCLVMWHIIVSYSGNRVESSRTFVWRHLVSFREVQWRIAMVAAGFIFVTTTCTYIDLSKEHLQFFTLYIPIIV